jgi:hypothetical protein
MQQQSDAGAREQDNAALQPLGPESRLGAYLHPVGEALQRISVRRYDHPSGTIRFESKRTPAHPTTRQRPPVARPRSVKDELLARHEIRPLRIDEWEARNFADTTRIRMPQNRQRRRPVVARDRSPSGPFAESC